jgi:phage tail P2-like protein
MFEDLFLPQNATPLEKTLSSVDRRVSAINVDIIRQVHNPDTCPPPWLPILALAWSVDEWDTTWPEERKREAIRSAVEVHRRKGTWGAMRRAIAALGKAGTLEEWYNYDGDPYHFRILVDLTREVLSLEDMQTITRVALNTKNVRSFFEGFSALRTVPGEVYALAGAFQDMRMIFQPLEVYVPTFGGDVYAIAGYAPVIHTAVFEPL